ncbi:hypothetical protein L596_029682 [Steinernema carpocapsae]|uniref:C-type lectin domain-containing protein n=1 Tax=Steinernema carpocapsae TaxID=34508 RepID=A0A4U5LQH9_STECR|nr:hypothetical protein L596_029682 [Steinernema carpocapsae]
MPQSVHFNGKIRYLGITRTGHLDVQNIDGIVSSDMIVDKCCHVEALQKLGGWDNIMCKDQRSYVCKIKYEHANSCG